MTEWQAQQGFSLPEKWIWVKIEDICTVRGRVGWKGYKKSDLRSSGPFVIGATHLSDRWRLDITKPVFISRKKYEESEEIKVSVGDLIVAQRGSIGKLALVDFSMGEATINPCVLLLKNIMINSHFLLYELASPHFQDHLRKGNKSTTTPMITQEFVKNSQIPLAPVPEQRRIVDKVEELFSFLDAGVESLRKVQAQLKRYRQAVLKYAFEGKLTEEWRKNHKDRAMPNRNLLENNPPNELVIDGSTVIQKLPEEWFWIKLSKISDSMKNGIYRPSSFYAEEGFACLRMYNIENGSIVWKDIKRMKLTREEIEEYALKPGYIGKPSK